MTDGISNETIERLEAELLTADAEEEELTVVVESEVEEKDAEVEELQAEVEEKDAEVEELQAEVEEKDAEVEELRESVNMIAETYAEELAEETPALDVEDYMERFDFEELQEMHEETFDDSGASPNPQSGDPGAGFQSPEGNEGSSDGEPEELSGKAKAAVESFQKRGGVWSELAEDIEENGLGEVRRSDKVDEDAIFE